MHAANALTAHGVFWHFAQQELCTPKRCFCACHAQCSKAVALLSCMFWFCEIFEAKDPCQAILGKPCNILLHMQWDVLARLLSLLNTPPKMLLSSLCRGVLYFYPTTFSRKPRSHCHDPAKTAKHNMPATQAPTRPTSSKPVKFPQNRSKSLKICQNFAKNRLKPPKRPKTAHNNLLLVTANTAAVKQMQTSSFKQGRKTKPRTMHELQPKAQAIS